MRTLILKRTGLAAFQLFVVGSIVFLLVRLVPGDPARATLGDAATKEQVTQVRSLMHLDDALWEQYLGFWGRLLRGDLGVSLISGRTVLEDLPVRIGNSLELVLLALGIALLIGIPLGRIAATRANTAVDHAVTAGAVLGISMPVFVLGTLLLLMLGVWWPVLPPERFVPFTQDPLTHLRVIVLPLITLTAASTAVVVRMTRSAMLETLNADFVRTARAKGVSEKLVIRRHALRASLLPVVSASSVELTTLIGSTVLVETIFGWPGMSSLLMNAVSLRDYPVIQAVVLGTATIVIVVNLVADISVRFLDPRAESV